MTKILLILAGGKSSRMKNSDAINGISKSDIEAANKKSKGLIEINDRPFMDYIIYNAKMAGITDVIILTGEDGSEMRENYGSKNLDNDFHGMSLSYAVQHIPEGRVKPFGTADAVSQAMEQIEILQKSEFIVCNCDNLYSEEGFKNLVDLDSPHGWLNYDRSGLDFPKEQVEAFAITSVNEKSFLQKIIEKPTKEDVEKYSDANGIVRVSMNIFKFDGNVFYDYVKNCPINPKRNEKELPTAIMNMINENPDTMYGIPICEHVPDLTRKEDILKVRKYLENQNINW